MTIKPFNLSSKKTKLFHLSVVASVFMFGCGGGGGSDQAELTKKQAPPTYQYQIPSISDDGWQVAHLNDVQMDETLLTELMQRIYQNNDGKTDAITIIKDGKLVFDENIRAELDYVDTNEGNSDLNKHYMASVTKSFASALIGIALDQQPSYTLDEPVLNFYTQYAAFENEHDWKHQSTLKNFLTMRHGFKADDSLIDGLDSNSDFIKTLFDQPVGAQPGTKFQYSSLVSIALGDIASKITNMPTRDFAQTYLFDPLNIEEPKWLLTPKGRANTGYGLWLSTRDMAKFGQLYLQQGEWQGEQIISSQWVTMSTKQHVTLEEGYLVNGYGFQWWTESHYVSGEVIETYFAGGNGGQFIVVVPELDLVTVLTGHNYNAYKETRRTMQMFMREYILPSILTANN